MENVDKEILLSVMEEHGEVDRNYSGRGMYGETCLGVVISDSSIFDLMFDVYDETGYRLPDPHTDAMGMDTIYYWPGLKVEEE